MQFAGHANAMKTLFKIFFCLSITLAVASPFFVGAQSSTTSEPYNPPNLPINTTLPIPNAKPISGPQGQGPAGIVANFYSFAFIIAGFLAFVMIVYGGVRYTFSGGSHTAKEEAKDAIKQALLGLGLLLVAYLILRTINPDLTTLKLPTLAPYVPQPVSVAPPGNESGLACGDPPTGAPDGSCAVGASCRCAVGGLGCHCEALQSTCAAADLLTPLLSDAQAMESGATVIWTSSNSNVNTNLAVLRQATADFNAALRAVGASGVINSAYRPYSYQKHFWEICDRFHKMGGNRSGSTITYANADPSCSALQGVISGEILKHGLNAACLVANPDGCAPHTKGVAVDIRLTGISYPNAEALLRRKNIKLEWRSLGGDEFHFEIPPIDRPFNGCVSEF
jgi:D-alanyl-D-alanine dipeptidase